jgi:hypothetical protein
MLPVRALRWAMSGYLLALLPTGIVAQSPRDTSRIPVTVVMAHPSADARRDITITRYAKDGYRIVIPRHLATPENLRVAILNVLEIVDRDGSALRDNQVFTVEPDEGPGPLRPNVGSQRVIDQLMTAAGRDGDPAPRNPSVRIFLSVPAAAAKPDGSDHDQVRTRP